MKKRKGFSLVEAVVAAAVSVIIVAGSTSVVIGTTRASADLSIRHSAVREVENVLTCYQSDNVLSGLKLLYQTETVSIEDARSLDAVHHYILYFNSSNECIGYKSFAIDGAAAAEPGDQHPEGAFWMISCIKNVDGIIKLKAIELSNQEEIYATEYEKA